MSRGIAALIWVGLFACLKRHKASISFWGSSRIFSTSKNELSGLIGLELPDTLRAASVIGDAFGGGGGWNAGGVPGTVDEEIGAPGSGVAAVEAFWRNS